jgi:hypothetical protein
MIRRSRFVTVNIKASVCLSHKANSEACYFPNEAGAREALIWNDKGKAVTGLSCTPQQLDSATMLKAMLSDMGSS